MGGLMGHRMRKVDTINWNIEIFCNIVETLRRYCENIVKTSKYHQNIMKISSKYRIDCIPFRLSIPLIPPSTFTAKWGKHNYANLYRKKKNGPNRPRNRRQYTIYSMYIRVDVVFCCTFLFDVLPKKMRFHNEPIPSSNRTCLRSSTSERIGHIFFSWACNTTIILRTNVTNNAKKRRR